MQSRGRLESNNRHRSSKSSASSISSSNAREEILLEPISRNLEKEQCVSQPVTLERGTKDHSKRSWSKHDSPHIGGGSLPRSPFFGSRKQEKGGLLNNSCMLTRFYCRSRVKSKEILIYRTSFKLKRSSHSFLIILHTSAIAIAIDFL